MKTKHPVYNEEKVSGQMRRSTYEKLQHLADEMRTAELRGETYVRPRSPRHDKIASEIALKLFEEMTKDTLGCTLANIANDVDLTIQQLAVHFLVPAEVMTGWGPDGDDCPMYVLLMMAECLGLYKYCIGHPEFDRPGEEHSHHKIQPPALDEEIYYRESDNAQAMLKAILDNCGCTFENLAQHTPNGLANRFMIPMDQVDTWFSHENECPAYIRYMMARCLGLLR